MQPEVCGEEAKKSVEKRQRRVEGGGETVRGEG